MITILLLSHNNPAHLKRALAYYKQIAFKGRILIADSSRQELKQEVRNIVTAVEEQLFAPVLLEYDTQLSYIEKVAAASLEVVTSYVLPAGVDDFFSQRGMYEAVHFLKTHPEYAFAYGKMYGFTYDGRGISSYYISCFDETSSFPQDSPLDRLRDFFPHSRISFYNVFRTPTFQKILQRSSLFARELATSDNFAIMLFLLEGKAKFLSVPFHWRELSDDSHGTILIKEWLLGEKFKQDFVRMKECLKEVFIEKKLCPSENAEALSSHCIDDFIKQRIALTFPQESFIKTLIRQKLPKNLFQTLARVRFGIKNFFIFAGRSHFSDKTSVYAREREIMNKQIVQCGIVAHRVGLEFAKRV